MSRLTWQNVGSPNFSGSIDALRLMGDMLRGSTNSLDNAIQGFQEGRTRRETGETMQSILSHQDPDQLQAALASGSMFEGRNARYLDPRAFDFAAQQRGRLLGERQTEAQTHLTGVQTQAAQWGLGRRQSEAARQDRDRETQRRLVHLDNEAQALVRAGDFAGAQAIYLGNPDLFNEAGVPIRGRLNDLTGDFGTVTGLQDSMTSRQQREQTEEFASTILSRAANEDQAANMISELVIGGEINTSQAQHLFDTIIENSNVYFPNRGTLSDAAAVFAPPSSGSAPRRDNSPVDAALGAAAAEVPENQEEAEGAADVVPPASRASTGRVSSGSVPRNQREEAQGPQAAPEARPQTSVNEALEAASRDEEMPVEDDFIPDTGMTTRPSLPSVIMPGDELSYEEMAQLTRAQRQQLGLPESQAGMRMAEASGSNRVGGGMEQTQRRRLHSDVGAALGGALGFAGSIGGNAAEQVANSATIPVNALLRAASGLDDYITGSGREAFQFPLADYDGDGHAHFPLNAFGRGIPLDGQGQRTQTERDSQEATNPIDEGEALTQTAQQGAAEGIDPENISFREMRSQIRRAQNVDQVDLVYDTFNRLDNVLSGEVEVPFISLTSIPTDNNQRAHIEAISRELGVAPYFAQELYDFIGGTEIAGTGGMWNRITNLGSATASSQGEIVRRAGEVWEVLSNPSMRLEARDQLTDARERREQLLSIVDELERNMEREIRAASSREEAEAIRRGYETYSLPLIHRELNEIVGTGIFSQYRDGQTQRR